MKISKVILSLFLFSLVVLLMIALKIKHDNSVIITLPVSFHVMTSNKISKRQARPMDIDRALIQVNDIWLPAGIQFTVREITYNKVDEQEKTAGANRRDVSVKQGILLMRNRCQYQYVYTSINVCVMAKNVKRIAGAAYTGNNPFIIWPIRLAKNHNRFDARVLSHELGHYFGLLHNNLDGKYLMRKGRHNAMRNNRKNTILTDSEIKRARSVALSKSLLTYIGLSHFFNNL